MAAAGVGECAVGVAAFAGDPRDFDGRGNGSGGTRCKDAGMFWNGNGKVVGRKK